MEAERLKPCPFCGQTEDDTDRLLVYQHVDSRLWIVSCEQCNASVDASTEAEARTAWNRRVSLRERLTREPHLVDLLLRGLNGYALGAGIQYALPLSKATDTNALRALVLAWVQRVEGRAQDGQISAQDALQRTITPEHES